MDRDIPGPGRYENEKPLGEEALKYSITGRKGGTVIFDKLLDNPGPGEYECLEIQKTGKYPVSSFRNTTNSIQWKNYKLGRFANDSKIFNIIFIFYNFILFNILLIIFF